MYIQRPPKWLWENYCYLFDGKKKEVFEFEEALRILKISKEMLLKTLSELEKRGLLIKWRSEYDHRIKKYKLVSKGTPKLKGAMELIEDYTMGEPKEKNQLNLTEKLQLITQILQEQKEHKMRYLITGSTCAYYYHKYITPPKVFEIKILNEDMDKWVFFLTDRNTKVYGWTEKQAIEIPSNEKHKFVVRLYKWLSDEEYGRKEENNGLLYQSKEDLILELIKKRTRLSITEAIAIILTNKINWEQLEEVFRRNPLQRELGAILDIIYNSNKGLVSEKFIKELKKRVEGESLQLFPADIIPQEEYDELLKRKEQLDYQDLSKKWGLPIVLPEEVIKKIFEDLINKSKKK